LDAKTQTLRKTEHLSREKKETTGKRQEDQEPSKEWWDTLRAKVFREEKKLWS